MFQNVAEWYKNRTTKSTSPRKPDPAASSKSPSPTKSNGRRSRGSRTGSLKKLSRTSSSKSLFGGSQSPEPILEAGGRATSPAPPSKSKPKSKMGRTKSTEAAAKLQKVKASAVTVDATDGSGGPAAGNTVYGVQNQKQVQNLLLPGIPSDTPGTADTLAGVAGAELQLDVLEAHVVLIQSAWRGACARAEVDEMRAEAAELAAEGVDPVQEQAAITIQAAIRGHQHRQSTRGGVKYTRDAAAPSSEAAIPDALPAEVTAPVSPPDWLAWDSATSPADKPLGASPTAAAADTSALAEAAPTEAAQEAARAPPSIRAADARGRKHVKQGVTIESYPPQRAQHGRPLGSSPAPGNPDAASDDYDSPTSAVEEQLTAFFR